MIGPVNRPMKLGDRHGIERHAGVSRVAAALAARAGRRPAGVDPADSAALLGIPDCELTPRTRGALDRLFREVGRLHRDLERAKKRALALEALADRDALTPGLNRRAFIRELERSLAFAERYRAPSSLVYLDVNDMKRINDCFGHGAGDAALRHVASVLVENVRSFDVVGRLGGDEFAVILAQIDGAAALAKARSLAEAIEDRPVAWNGGALRVRVTCGVHTFVGTERVDDALHAADRAMYARKRTPKPHRAAA
jgi:diguanylate cyclase (GGDEF)-like protein